jgi:PAT family beta-lactamase induction signal transducer AmpG
LAIRLPNLLATRKGRLAAFFGLYLTEGIPLGFATVAVVTQLRREGVGPAEIGAFVASFYLPWAFKWAFGPFVDVFASERLGRRRGWILGTQVTMVATLLSTVLLDLPAQLGLFTAILLVHNTFAAMQDVAIDALAVSALSEAERGLANGLMFAGAALGQVIGGAGVLLLSGYTGFQPTFFFVSASLLLVTVFIVLPMKEAAGPPREALAGPRLLSAGREMRDFAANALRSFVGTRGAFIGLFFSLLPAGAMSLGLALQSNLAVELGFSDDEVAWLSGWSSAVMAGFCVLGGWLSDRLGRRRTLAVYLAGMSLPVVYLMLQLQQHGWITPVSMDAAARPAVPPALVTALWVATIAYNAFMGLMYGTRSAILMDVTNPAVAGTQFTAYMALMNLAIAYSALWQGIAAEAWGYPMTLAVDAFVGLLGIALIPWLRRPRDAGAEWADRHAATRARRLCAALALLCFAWPAYLQGQAALGAAQPIFETLFTLIFVASAVFLLAGAAVLRPSAHRLVRLGLWLAPALLLMHARHHVDAAGAALGGWVDPALFTRGAHALLLAVPLAAGAVLLGLALKPWGELRERRSSAGERASVPEAGAAAPQARP